MWSGIWREETWQQAQATQSRRGEELSVPSRSLVEARSMAHGEGGGGEDDFSLGWNEDERDNKRLE